MSICAPNTIGYPAILYGIMRAGGIPALSSPAFSEDEMMHVFKIVDCKIVFCPSDIASVVQGALKKMGRTDDCIITIDDNSNGGSEAGIQSLEDLIEEGRRSRQVEAWRMPKGKSNSEVCALLCFSSGTTGLPKAVSLGVFKAMREVLG